MVIFLVTFILRILYRYLFLPVTYCLAVKMEHRFSVGDEVKV